MLGGCVHLVVFVSGVNQAGLGGIFWAKGARMQNDFSCIRQAQHVRDWIQGEYIHRGLCFDQQTQFCQSGLAPAHNRNVRVGCVYKDWKVLHIAS